MKQYAFITGGRSDFPDPFMVEMSRRTKTRPRQVAFFEPDVVYCPSVANQVLRSVSGRRLHRVAVHKALVKLFGDNDDGSSVTEVDCVEVVVKATILEEAVLFTRGYFKKCTRRSSFVLSKILTGWKQVRQRRMEEERHLPSQTLGEELCRSMTELRTVVKGECNIL
jgi:hypothetical protein